MRFLVPPATRFFGDRGAQGRRVRGYKRARGRKGENDQMMCIVEEGEGGKTGEGEGETSGGRRRGLDYI